ncbi:histidine kinase [Herbaspirillum hiltneri N3]|uniref:Histidine kinase n=1 Tax=Herbaspirillum hiltneri N3 TaxID=1262470 RepID=A0ABN4I3I1_9BURK|nr:response regulator transcription factor [Herbaspirillum hiltneri]AKZ64146.1 histidine kinase [Herbaspirillum hiltneri N3]
MSLILNKVLQIAIADDHPVVLNALKHELGRLPEFRIVLMAQTGDELLESLQRTPCEVVITDFAMPTEEKDEADGFILIKRIRTEFPSTKLIVYTAMNNSAVVKRLYRMGVFSVISKKEKAEELVSACLATQSNKQVYFPVSLRGELEMSWAQGDAFAQNKELTMSELEVVRLFVGGCSLGDICDRLSRTPSTVSTHKNNAMRKLGLTTDADLIKYAYATGMI